MKLMQSNLIAIEHETFSPFLFRVLPPSFFTSHLMLHQHYKGLCDGKPSYKGSGCQKSKMSFATFNIFQKVDVATRRQRRVDFRGKRPIEEERRAGARGPREIWKFTAMISRENQPPASTRFSWGSPTKILLIF